MAKNKQGQGLATGNGGDILTRPMTTAELSACYGVTVKTVRKWIRPHKDRLGARVGYIWTPRQVAIIIEVLGPWQ